MQKHCSKCNIVFQCKNEGPGCWCEEVNVPLESLKHLKEQFDNCLCQECLQVYDASGKNAETKALFIQDIEPVISPHRGNILVDKKT